MTRKLTRRLAASIFMGVCLLGYNNCTGPGDLGGSNNAGYNPDIYETNLSGRQNIVPETLTEKISLSGKGDFENRASGCTVVNLNDWLETANSYAKRIEPHDCAKVSVATPIFAWPQPRDLGPGSGYTLHIFGVGTNYDYSLYPTTTRALMNKTMPAGQFKWTVTYKNSSGAVITSSPRLFEVPPGNLFSIPNGAQFAKAVLAKSHPRIQPNEGPNPNNKVPWATVIDRVRTRGYGPAFNYFFLTQLGNSVNAKLPTLPANRNQLLDLKTAVVNLAYGYNLWNDVNYFLKAVPLLEGVAAWPLDCGTPGGCDDQINREIHSILATSLDLFQWKLSEPANVSLRNKLVNVLLQRLDLVNFTSFNSYPYDSHLLTNSIYSIESLMYAAGTPGLDQDGGAKRLAYLWENAVTSVGVWGGTVDAGWSNSVGYGWYAADTYARLMADAKLMANIDLSSWPALSNFGYNQIYFTSPLDSIREPFGDETDVTDHYKNYSGDTFRLYALLTGKPEYEWYWRLRGDASANNKFMWNPLHFMLAAATPIPKTFPAWSPLSLPRSIVFENAGVAALHSDMSKADRTSVYFRSSFFGSFNHSHADNNAFTFVSKGTDMLISAGVYDTYDTPYHENIVRATRYKNALTFDGGIGQAEPTEVPTAPGAPHKGLLDFKGQIVNFQDDGTWAVVTGDATDAYRGMNLNVGRAVRLLTSAYRTIAYNRTLGVVLIYDRAQSATPRRWELNFHTLKSNSPALSGSEIKLTNLATSACMKVWTPSAYYYEAFKEGWEGYAPKANIGRPVFPEVHMRMAVRANTTDFASVTVINEGCKNFPINVSFSGNAATAFVNGSTIDFNGLSVQTP